MIRRLQKLDINKIADIWLDTNMKAHNFIPTQYWTDNYKTVKESIEKAEVYVYEDGNNVLGFVGLSEDYYETAVRQFDSKTKFELLHLANSMASENASVY